MFRASGQLSASFLPGLRASEVSWQHSRIGSSRIWSESFRTLHTPRNPELLNSRHSRPPTWVGGASAPRNQTRNANQYASPPPHSYDRSTHVGPGTGTAWSQDTVASFPAILRQAITASPRPCHVGLGAGTALSPDTVAYALFHGKP